MSSDTLSDDFDDDDIFDHVNVETILQSSQLPSTAKEPTRGQQPRRESKADPQLDDSLFDDVDADELIRSSQPTNKLQKRGRGSDALSRGDDGDNQQASLGTDHLASSKRQKTDHESTLWQNTQKDKANVKLARKLLADKFGYKSFRHEQEGAIRRILAGENTLVIFPTGAGKSLCYQVSCLQSQFFHFLLTVWFA